MESSSSGIKNMNSVACNFADFARNIACIPVFQIRIGFNADPDPAFYLHAVWVQIQEAKAMQIWS